MTMTFANLAFTQLLVDNGRVPITAVEEAKARRALPSPAMRRAVRVNARVSMRAIAEDIGVSVAAVALWEVGKREPRGQNLIRYAAALRDLAEVTR
jgi:DNA-binding transcriptional regulator YiaG